MKFYKESRYNIKVNYSQSELLLFNCLTSSIIKIKKENYKKMLEILGIQKELRINSEFIKKMKDMGFIVNTDFDEQNYVKIKNRQWRHNPYIYSIAIVPNLDCNFRCKYCFENLSKNYMSEDVITSIEKFINNRIEKQLINSLGVSWYGGEPLLSKKIIERLSASFLKIDKYRSTLFTNGYSFTDDFISNLLNYKITLVHITLDGPQEIHDKYRYLKNGEGSYAKIKENIIKIINTHGNKVNINIRTNLDQNNLDYYQLLIDEFDEFKKYKVSFQFHKIKKFETGASANYCGEMNNDEFNKLYFESIKELSKRGFKKPSDFIPKNLDYKHCFVGLDNGFTISYDGSIYKCFGDSNPPRNKVGQLLSDGEIKYIDAEFYKWFGYDYYDNLDCRNCELLPICMGGCAHQRLGLTYNEPAKCNKKVALNYISDLIKEIYNLKN